MRYVTSALERIRRVPSTFWLQFFSACVVAFFLEQAADRLVEPKPEKTSAAAQSIFDISRVYQQLVTTGPRRPISHYTTIVEIDPAKDHLAVNYRNLCPQRAFLASLLRVVASANPAVIVVDKYFDNSQCLKDNEEKEDTAELECALSTLALQVPIVSGVDATPTTDPRSLPSSALAPADDASLYGLGILNLDFDTRRLPLRWELDKDKYADILSKTRSKFSQPSSTSEGFSLALQAAGEYDRRILDKNRRLKKMTDHGENPYISFLGDKQFTQFYAGEILCLVPNPEIAGSCDEVPRHDPKASRPTLRDLSHQIVVIGERSAREDNHNSLIGEVPGFYLQANYIEALLDDRVFRPVHPLFNYVLGFLIFAIFEYILLKNSRKLLRALAWMIVLLVATLAVLYFAVVQFGYYLNPVTVGLLAIAIAIGHLVFARLESHEEPEKELHQAQGS